MCVCLWCVRKREIERVCIIICLGEEREIEDEGAKYLDKENRDTKRERQGERERQRERQRQRYRERDRKKETESNREKKRGFG